MGDNVKLEYAEGTEIITALNKLFDKDDNYRLIVYGDGSGHFETDSGDVTVRFNSWRDLAELSYSTELKKAVAEFVQGARVLLIGGRYKGQNAVVDKMTTHDGLVRITGTTYGDGFWERYQSLRLIPMLAVKDDIVYHNTKSVHDRDKGIILALENSVARIWLECDHILDVPVSDLTKI